MKELLYSRAFYRDLARMEKRGKNLTKLDAITKKLVNGERLESKHKPHPLKGEWKPHWDCHIEPDWVLVYEETSDTVRLYRTGTHSDLFK